VEDHVSRRCRGFHYSGAHDASNKRERKKGMKKEKDEAGIQIDWLQVTSENNFVKMMSM